MKVTKPKEPLEVGRRNSLIYFGWSGTFPGGGERWVAFWVQEKFLLDKNKEGKTLWGQSKAWAEVLRCRPVRGAHSENFDKELTLRRRGHEPSWVIWASF
jgi:hypothetical protein